MGVQGNRQKASCGGELRNTMCEKFGSEERAYLTGKQQVKGALHR